MIRIYGENTRGSYSQVTMGLVQSCRHHGLLAGFMPTISTYDDINVPGSEAPIAICSGAPTQISLMHTDGIHQKRWYMLAANSEGIPEKHAAVFQKEHPVSHMPMVNGLLSPSVWGKGVLERAIPGIPVVVMPHGVRSVYAPMEGSNEWLIEQYIAHGRFNVLHVTSSWTSRKGTHELLQAWASLMRREFAGEAGHGVQLVILAHPLRVQMYAREAQVLGLTAEQVKVRAGLGLTDEEFVGTYSHSHVVCQPSRAEGFGMVPLEARACGVPVVATICTGHSEHMKFDTPGVVAVPHYELAACDDYPGAMAPTIKAEDIAVALATARTNWMALKQAAMDNVEFTRKEWAWENVTEAPLKALAAEGTGTAP